VLAGRKAAAMQPQSKDALRQKKKLWHFGRLIKNIKDNYYD
jgi:hypothetical protein